jgi:hypothetical protein
MNDAKERLKKLNETNLLVEQARDIYERSVCSFMGCESCLGDSLICPLKHIKQAMDVYPEFAQKYRIKLKDYYMEMANEI